MKEKKYIKVINGTTIIKEANSIIVTLDDKCIYNPSEDIILSDGWIKYIEENNFIENDKLIPSLEEKKEEKIKDILSYDSSDKVNIFRINNNSLWIDKATRVGLSLRFESELAHGLEETTLWFDGISYTLDISMAKKMLRSLEFYASQCYDVTQEHIANVRKLTTIEEVNNYNYKTGYPSILSYKI
jgi:hypothetical protein